MASLIGGNNHNNNIAHVVACLQAAPRVLFMRAFTHLYEGKPSGLNTLNILRSNGHMVALQHAINQTVIDDFTAAREAVRVSSCLELWSGRGWMACHKLNPDG